MIPKVARFSEVMPNKEGRMTARETSSRSEGEAALDRRLSELLAQPIDRRLALGVAHHLGIGEVAAIGLGGVAQVGGADADEAEGGAVACGPQQPERRVVEPAGKLRRRQPRGACGCAAGIARP